MMETDKLRALTEEQMVPRAPLAVALTIIADALDALARGIEATGEQFEGLEARILPHVLERLGVLEDRVSPPNPQPFGVHVLGRAGTPGANGRTA